MGNVISIYQTARMGATMTDVSTILRQACEKGDASLVSEILDNSEKQLSEPEQQGELLHIASSRGNSEVVEVLLKHGVPVNFQTGDGWCALMHASQNEHAEVVEMLLQNGAQVDLQQEDGWTSLMIASRNGHTEVVKILLKNKAQVNLRKEGGSSALTIATQYRHTEVVKLLVENGALVNLQKEDGLCALMIASENGHVELVNILLENRAEVDLQKEHGWSSLMIAGENGHAEVVKILLKNGAQIDLQKEDGSSAIFIASENGDAEVVKILVDNGAQVNLQREDRWCALMIASQNGHAEVVKVLVEYGAQVNWQKGDGSCALMIASQNGHAEVVKILLKGGAQVNLQKEHGWCSLMIASQNGHAEVVKLLLDGGAQVNLQREDGSSALMIAYQNRQAEIVRILLENGAQKDMLEKSGWCLLSPTHSPVASPDPQISLTDSVVAWPDSLVSSIAVPVASPDLTVTLASLDPPPSSHYPLAFSNDPSASLPDPPSSTDPKVISPDLLVASTESPVSASYLPTSSTVSSSVSFTDPQLASPDPPVFSTDPPVAYPDPNSSTNSQAASSNQPVPLTDLQVALINPPVASQDPLASTIDQPAAVPDPNNHPVASPDPSVSSIHPPAATTDLFAALPDPASPIDPTVILPKSPVSSKYSPVSSHDPPAISTDLPEALPTPPVSKILGQEESKDIASHSTGTICPYNVEEIECGDDEVLDKEGFPSVGEVNATYTGKKMEIKSDDLGIQIRLQNQDLPPGVSECSVSVSVAASGKFDFPGSSQLVSGVCKFYTSLVLENPCTLTMDHCAAGKSIHNLSFASSANTVPPFLYKYVRGGNFTETHGEIEIDQFHSYAIVEKHGEEGFLSLYERKYQICLHCSKNPTIARPSCLTWNLFFSMVKNCSIFQRSVEKYFLKYDTERLSNVVVKFDKDSQYIALTLEGDRVEVQRGWSIISLVTCSIEKNHVDCYADGEPPCFCLILLQNSDKNPQDLLYKFKINGAEKPECYINIFKPVTINQGSVKGPTHEAHYKRYLSKIKESRKVALQMELKDDGHLCKVAEVLLNWQEKFYSFELSYSDFINITTGRNKDNQILQRFEVLNLWRKRSLEHTYDNLLKICVQGGFRRSAEVIVSIINEMEI